MAVTNYQSASEMVRNLNQIHAPYTVKQTDGKFRVIQFPKLWDGREFWIVNEKGFMWEPCNTYDDATRYLASDEAKEYNGK